MGLEDGASPHSGRASYIHGNGSTPPYMSSHSPTPQMTSGMSYNSYPDNIVYTSIGAYHYIIEFLLPHTNNRDKKNSSFECWHFLLLRLPMYKSKHPPFR